MSTRAYTRADVHLTRRLPPMVEVSGYGWQVMLGAVYVGEVRRTDGEWTAATWTMTGNGPEPERLAGNWRFRASAVADVVAAWLDANPDDPPVMSVLSHRMPRCPHDGQRVRWAEDQWYCPSCGAEWAEGTLTISDL